ncbi:hypothetical protein [Methylomicrobium lacus]|uniref:hypothetical protein n=1 Tax=Methylomicrobium lacus TaxID=136992 RepID=UPI001268A570|nr:hypothetical protein [Methylomicrobium lacus]
MTSITDFPNTTVNNHWFISSGFWYSFGVGENNRRLAAVKRLIQGQRHGVCLWPILKLSLHGSDLPVVPVDFRLTQGNRFQSTRASNNKHMNFGEIILHASRVIFNILESKTPLKASKGRINHSHLFV